MKKTNIQGRCSLSLLKQTVLFIALFLVAYWATIGVMNYEALDLGRNLEESEILEDMYSAQEFITMRRETKIDFIYYVINFIAVSKSIPLELITSLTIAIYYFIIIRLMRESYSRKYGLFVILTVLFTTPLVWVASVSRNLMAIMFFYVAILLFYHNKKLLGTLFVLISVFTHFSCIIYIFLLIPVFYLRKQHFSSSTIYFLLFLITILGFILPSFISPLLSFLGSTGFSSYSSIQISNFLISDYSYGDKIAPLFAYIFSLYLMCINKHRDKEFWMLFMLTFFLSLSLNIGYNYIIRCMMFMPLIWGINIADIYSYSPMMKKKVKTVSIVAMLPIILNIYAYRPLFFYFL